VVLDPGHGANGTANGTSATRAAALRND
jgi:hypothetical protein